MTSQLLGPRHPSVGSINSVPQSIWNGSQESALTIENDRRRRQDRLAKYAPGTRRPFCAKPATSSPGEYETSRPASALPIAVRPAETECPQSAPESAEKIHRAGLESHTSTRDIATSANTQTQKNHQNRQAQTHAPTHDSPGNGDISQVWARHNPSPFQKSP